MSRSWEEVRLGGGVVGWVGGGRTWGSSGSSSLARGSELLGHQSYGPEWDVHFCIISFLENVVWATPLQPLCIDLRPSPTRVKLKELRGRRGVVSAGHGEQRCAQREGSRLGISPGSREFRKGLII